MPAHNSDPYLREALQQLVRKLDHDDVEVIIMENGSSDDTWEITEKLTPGPRGLPIQIFRFEVGLGAAYLKGASEARDEAVLPIADGLPFGATSIRPWESVGNLLVLVVDSEAHPGSVVPRLKLRAVISWGYRSPRRVILGMTVGGCQGTLFVSRTWLQYRIPLLRERGYLANAEVVHLAQMNRRRVVEVPTVLQTDHERGGTWIRIADVWDITIGLVRPRRRRHMLRVAFKES